MSAHDFTLLAAGGLIGFALHAAGPVLDALGARLARWVGHKLGNDRPENQ